MIEVIVEKFSSGCEEVGGLRSVEVAMQATRIRAAGALSALAETCPP